MSCEHNKYDGNPNKRFYEAAYEYRKSGQRTMFPLVVQAVIEQTQETITEKRRIAIQQGVYCAVGACLVTAAQAPEVIDVPLPPIDVPAPRHAQSVLTAKS